MELPVYSPRLEPRLPLLEHLRPDYGISRCLCWTGAMPLRFGPRTTTLRRRAELIWDLPIAAQRAYFTATVPSTPQWNLFHRISTNNPWAYARAARAFRTSPFSTPFRTRKECRSLAVARFGR